MCPGNRGYASNVTGNGLFTFSYDDTPNMSCSNCAGAARADYTYDGKSMRVKTVKNGVTTYSFYAANGNLLFEQDGVSNAYSDYLYLKDKLLSKQSPASTLYYHDDLLGSPMAATDAAGALAWRENYRPYGTQLLGTGNPTNELWFTGKSHDQDTKLSYLGARYYDTQIGRFMGVDPALFDETNLHSVNRYAYANNNPYRLKDPTGAEGISTLWMSHDAPIVVAGQAFAAIAAYGVGIATGNQRLMQAAVDSMRENQEASINSAVMLGTIGKSGRVASEAIPGAGRSSKYTDSTVGGSVLNRTTDVRRADFERNLTESGWTRSVSRDGKATLFEKEGARYAIRDGAKSTGSPSADYFKAGSKEVDLKIRLSE